MNDNFENYEDIMLDYSDDGNGFIPVSRPSNRNELIRVLTQEYIQNLDPDNLPTPDEMASELINTMKTEFGKHNSKTSRKDKWALPECLLPSQIADLMLATQHIKNINFVDEKPDDTEYTLLGMYQDSGKNEGIYVTSEIAIAENIAAFRYGITQREIKETFAWMQMHADTVARCNDPDLIAVNNGIFNYKTKILQPFDPEYVFIAKSNINYNPTATNVIIHNDDDGTDWDVETWIKGLFEDGSDIPETIWQIIGATIRPNVRWNKSAWFVSERGNNGKGTLCELMRNVVGKQVCVKCYNKLVTEMANEI